MTLDDFVRHMEEIMTNNYDEEHMDLSEETTSVAVASISYSSSELLNQKQSITLWIDLKISAKWKYTLDNWKQRLWMQSRKDCNNFSSQINLELFPTDSVILAKR